VSIITESESYCMYEMVLQIIKVVPIIYLGHRISQHNISRLDVGLLLFERV
jgi:hypothetical protein